MRRSMMMIAVGLAVASALVATLATADPAGPPTVKLSAGLEARLSVVGRSKDRTSLSVALVIENKGQAAVQIALVGPAPHAIDNAGATYQFGSFSGAAACRELSAEYLPSCLTGEPIHGQRIPIALEAFTQIDPGTTTTLTFGLLGPSGTGTRLGFSSVVAYRVVTDAAKDAVLSEGERRRQLRTLSISFPMFAVNDVK